MPKPTREALELIGFAEVGAWTASGTTIVFKLGGKDAAVSDVLVDTPNALYAFVRGDEVQYVGKTTQGVRKRFAGYRNPGSGQATNIRCNARIRDSATTAQGVFAVTVTGGKMPFTVTRTASDQSIFNWNTTPQFTRAVEEFGDSFSIPNPGTYTARYCVTDASSPPQTACSQTAITTVGPRQPMDLDQGFCSAASKSVYGTAGKSASGSVSFFSGQGPFTFAADAPPEMGLAFGSVSSSGGDHVVQYAMSPAAGYVVSDRLVTVHVTDASSGKTCDIPLSATSMPGPEVIAGQTILDCPDPAMCWEWNRSEGPEGVVYVGHHGAALQNETFGGRYNTNWNSLLYLESPVPDPDYERYHTWWMVGTPPPGYGMSDYERSYRNLFYADGYKIYRSPAVPGTFDFRWVVESNGQRFYSRPVNMTINP